MVAEVTRAVLAFYVEGEGAVPGAQADMRGSKAEGELISVSTHS